MKNILIALFVVFGLCAGNKGAGSAIVIANPVSSLRTYRRAISRCLHRRRFQLEGRLPCNSSAAQVGRGPRGVPFRLCGKERFGLPRWLAQPGFLGTSSMPKSLDSEAAWSSSSRTTPPPRYIGKATLRRREVITVK